MVIIIHQFGPGDFSTSKLTNFFAEKMKLSHVVISGSKILRHLIMRYVQKDNIG